MYDRCQITVHFCNQRTIAGGHYSATDSEHTPYIPRNSETNKRELLHEQNADIFISALSIDSTAKT